MSTMSEIRSFQDHFGLRYTRCPAVVRNQEAESSTTCHNMMDQNHFGMACKVAVAAMLC